MPYGPRDLMHGHIWGTQMKLYPSKRFIQSREKQDLINTVSLGLQEEEIQEQDNVLDDLDTRVFNEGNIGIQVSEVAKIIGERKSRQDSISVFLVNALGC